MKPTTNITSESTKGITIDGITFQDTTFSKSGLLEVIDFLNAEEKESVFSIDGISIYYLGMSDFLAEFICENTLKQYLEKLSNIEFESNTKSQIPTVRGFFSSDDKFYTLLGAEHHFAGNEDKTPYGYKGIIFDLDSYNGISGVIKDSKGTTGEIL